jgi:hypothetical protein
MLERTSPLVHPEQAVAHCALHAPTELPGEKRDWPVSQRVTAIAVADLAGV